jgi:hypothetical protein
VIVTDPLEDALAKLDEEQLRAAGKHPELAAALLRRKARELEEAKPAYSPENKDREAV